MKKFSAGRRVARKIGQDDDELSSTTNTHTAAAEASEPNFRKPAAKARKSSSLRTSFGPSVVDDDEEASDSSGVITPKRSNLSRIAIQRNASKRSSHLASNLPARELDDDDSRPNYNAAALQQLKDSTPSTPRELASDVDDVSSGTQALDLSSKFGASLARYEQLSAIPSATEIAEKKARRARMAQELQAEEYISLDPDDPGLDADEDLDDNVMRDELSRLVLKPKDKYNKAESRLVREDEDIMENFDDFTEDGKISLGRKAEAEAARRRKDEMAAQIAAAEGGGDDSDSEASDSSEKLRNEAFEAAQTRHGTYAAANAAASDPYAHLRPKTPPKISPLPTLDAVTERLKGTLAEMQTSRAEKLRMMDELQREKIKMGEDEIRIQKALKETAEKFRLLRVERGIDGPVARGGTPAAIDAPPELSAAVDAGLRSAPADLEDVEDGDAMQRNGLGGGGFGAGAGLGFGMRGFGGTGGLGMPRGDTDEEN